MAHIDYNNTVRSFTVGKAARCGFTLNGYKGPEKIAARRREVYKRMAKIQDGWRTK